MCELGTKPRPDFFYCFKKFSLEIETFPWFECALRVSQISDKRECACVCGWINVCMCSAEARPHCYARKAK